MSNHETHHINFTSPKYHALKRAFQDASQHGKESFTFEGNEWVTAYAKYALEYLAPQFE